MRAVRNFVIERHISIVLVIPTGQNYKYRRLLLIALIDAKQKKEFLLDRKPINLLIVFELTNVLDVDDCVRSFEVCCEKLGLQVQ